MKSALFKLQSRADKQEENTQFMADAEVLFCRDPETGRGPDGYGWSIQHRIDEDYIAIWIRTNDAVMDMVCQDPRLELLEQLEGWPVDEPESEVIDV